MDYEGGKYRELLIDSIKDKEKKMMISKVLEMCKGLSKRYGDGSENEVVSETTSENFKFEFEGSMTISSSAENISNFPKRIEIIEADELKGISKKTFRSLDYGELRQFIYLVNHKQEIIEVLKTKLKEMEVLKKRFVDSQNIVRGYLAPYKALEEM